MNKIIIWFVIMTTGVFMTQADTVVWQTQTGAGTATWSDSLWTVGGTTDQVNPGFTGNTNTVDTGMAVLTTDGLALGGDLNITGGKVESTSNITSSGGKLSITGGANLTVTALDLRSSTIPLYDFNSGSVTFTSDIGILKNAGTVGINLTENFTITQTSNDNGTRTARDLIGRVTGGVFWLNGTQVEPATAWSGSNIDTVNSELEAIKVNGKYFFVTDAGSNGAQTLNVIPEPSSIGMIAMMSGTIIFIRRKLAM